MPRLTEMHWGIGLILLICILSFGVQATSMGLYWDDYGTIQIYQLYGADELTDWTGGEGRPFYGWILSKLWPLVGVTNTPWHLLELGILIVTVLLFWAVLRNVFPENPARNTLIALLFAVYPSYHLRPTVISSNLSMGLALLLLSFWLSVLAARRNNHLLAWLGALLIPAFQLIYEQGLPLEILRPLAMFWVIAHSLPLQVRLRRLALLWAPYLMFAVLVVFYRFFLF